MRRSYDTSDVPLVHYTGYHINTEHIGLIQGVASDIFPGIAAGCCIGYYIGCLSEHLIRY